MKQILIIISAMLIALGGKDLRVLTVTTTPEMHCQNCEKKIKENIRFEAGVKKIETDLEKQLVVITYDPAKTDRPEEKEKEVSSLAVLRLIFGGNANGVVLCVIFIHAVQVLQLPLTKSLLDTVGTVGQMFAHLTLPKAQHRPTHGVQSLVHPAVARHVAFYLSVPKVAVALNTLPLVLPVTTMPELAIDKHRYLAVLEADVGTAGHRTHILAIAIATSPQLPCKHPLGLSAAAAVALHTATTLFGSEVVGHGELKVES